MHRSRSDRVEKGVFLCYSETGGCTDEVEEDRVYASGGADMGEQYLCVGFKH